MQQLINTQVEKDIPEIKRDIKFLKWGLAIVVALVLGLYIK